MAAKMMATGQMPMGMPPGMGMPQANNQRQVPPV